MEAVRVRPAANGRGFPAEAPEIFLRSFVRQVLGPDRLDRDDPADQRVPGLVNAAHGPLADLLLYLVAAEPCSGVGDSGVLAQGTKLAFGRMITQSRRMRAATSIYPLTEGIRPSRREISHTAGYSSE